MASESILKFNEDQHGEYLKDESRAIGCADTISFPKDTQEVSWIMRQMHASKTPVTVQGARTGLSSGAVPVNGGHIINLSRMNKILNWHSNAEQREVYVDVQAGVVLKDLRLAVNREMKSCFFPPDPTEATATIGGMISCNASGACSYLYGATWNYIQSLTIVLANGEIIKINRGQYMFNGKDGNFTIGSSNINIRLPDYESTLPKNVAGYYSREGMDLIDLFIGSEGTLGIVTEARLKLITAPQEIQDVVFFFGQQANAVEFVERIRDNTEPCTGVKIAALEFINRSALQLINRFRESIPSFKQIPKIDPNFNSAVYMEFHGDNEESIEQALLGILETLNECGGEESTWFASDEKQIDTIKLFRHAVPESANAIIDEFKRENPGITTICTDMAVDNIHLKNMLNMYQQDMEQSGIEYIIYGHIGSNHLHVNMLPKTNEQYKTGIEIYNKWAQTIAGWGGTISAEHGIGKQKADMLNFMLSSMQIGQMKDIKRAFDPYWILNNFNIFSSR